MMKRKNFRPFALFVLLVILALFSAVAVVVAQSATNYTAPNPYDPARFNTWQGRTAPGTLNVGKSGTSSTTIQSADKTAGGTLALKEDATNGVVQLRAKDPSGVDQSVFQCAAGQCSFGDATNGSVLTGLTLTQLRAPAGQCSRIGGDGGVAGTGTVLDACPGGMVLGKGAAISASIVPINGGGLNMPSTIVGANGSTISGLYFGSEVISAASIPANSCANQTAISITGLTSSSGCGCSASTQYDAGSAIQQSGPIVTTNQVIPRLCNVTTGAVTPTASLGIRCICFN